MKKRFARLAPPIARRSPRGTSKPSPPSGPKNADLVDQAGHALKVQALLERARKRADEEGNIPPPIRKSETHSIRFITPDVALEDGTFEREVAADGSHQGRYTAVWVKRDGKWLLDGERESPVRADAVADPLPIWPGWSAIGPPPAPPIRPISRARGDRAKPIFCGRLP